jgi:betaine-aldehyde dehydrogenase
LTCLRHEIDQLVIGDPREATTDIGPLAFREHYERVLEHIEQAKSDGATLLMGGTPVSGGGYFVAPTVFTDVTPSMHLARDEVFGPVVAVLAWEDEDELFEAVNGTEYGLTARIWTRDVGRAQRFTDRVQSGLVWVNGYGGKPDGIPFGGFKLSGIGKEGGLEELIGFTREKGVISAPHTLAAK